MHTAGESIAHMATTDGRTTEGLRRTRWSLAAEHPRALEFVLEANAVRSIRVGHRPIEVTCAAGELWVTVEGDPEDHILHAGEAVSSGRRRLVAATALRPSRVRVVRGGQTGRTADGSAGTEGRRRWAVVAVAAAASFLTILDLWSVASRTLRSSAPSHPPRWWTSRGS